MLKFLDSASAAKPTAVASDGSTAAPAAAATPPKSRLNHLLEKPAAKPAAGLDVDVLSGLSLAARGKGGDKAAKGKGQRPKRPRPDDISCDAPCVDSFDITLSPLAAAPPASVRRRDRGLDRESSTGLAGVTGAFRGRGSTGSSSSSSSSGGSLNKISVANKNAKSESGGSGGGVGESSAMNGRSKIPAVATNSTNGGRARRQSTDMGGSGRGSSSSSSSSVGGSNNNSYSRGSSVSGKGKMGPWLSRPGETAICAEEGYDPLDLIHDANREIFGNDNFRGVQEDVRFL